MDKKRKRFLYEEHMNETLRPRASISVDICKGRIQLLTLGCIFSDRNAFIWSVLEALFLVAQDNFISPCLHSTFECTIVRIISVDTVCNIVVKLI